jgi:hypothetical protein
MGNSGHSRKTEGLVPHTQGRQLRTAQDDRKKPLETISSFFKSDEKHPAVTDGRLF